MTIFSFHQSLSVYLRSKLATVMESRNNIGLQWSIICDVEYVGWLYHFMWKQFWNKCTVVIYQQFAHY